MFARWRARAQNITLLIRSLPGLLFSARRRALLREMRQFVAELPEKMNAPILDVMADITPIFNEEKKGIKQETILREYADLAALLARRSPLGVCLRRSLVRYHFLRRVGIDVDVQFGARFVGGKPDRQVTGHAWLTQDGQPYYEESENWEGFTVMFSYPSASTT
jgi:hypothetical protein